MIEVTGLCCRYGKMSILDKITFTVSPGTLVSVLGENGAGKTTLFKALTGLKNDYSGSVKIEGEEVKDVSVQKLASRIAYIPQKQGGSCSYSVIDMVLMGTARRISPFSTPGDKEYSLAMAAIEQMEIRELAQRSYNRLSGGEQQLVLIARALAQDARVLIMDEPTSNLDYGNQIKVLRKAHALAREGYTILYSTHNPNHAMTYADAVLAIRQGRLECFGKPEDTVTEELMMNLYGERVRFIETDCGRVMLSESEGAHNV